MRDEEELKTKRVLNWGKSDQRDEFLVLNCTVLRSADDKEKFPERISTNKQQKRRLSNDNNLCPHFKFLVYKKESFNISKVSRGVLNGHNLQGLKTVPNVTQEYLKLSLKYYSLHI